MLDNLILFCAQRLSASEIRHAKPEKEKSQQMMCSTPFGIRDSTLLDATTPVTGLILCSTPFGIRDSTLFPPESVATILSGAQRLSASEIRHLVILQAFCRFRKCSTPFGIRDSTLYYLSSIASG